MNAWVLSLIMCAATPQADGSYCEALALRYALSREQCRAEVATWAPRLSHMKLECTEDPALSAALEEMEHEEQDEGQHDAGVVDPTLPWKVPVRLTR
jgi:hypothetical protein